jgi:hypothetical protein
MMDSRFAFGANIATTGASIDKKVVEDKALKLRLRNDDIHYRKAATLEEFCQRPQPGEQYRIITEKQFNSYALILNVLQDTDIERLWLSFYSINTPTAESLINLVETGSIKQANLIMSVFFIAKKTPPKPIMLLKKFCDANPNIRCAFVYNHSKVCALETSDGNHYVFEGSGNCTDNARIEQFVYENNQQTYDFHAAWMDKLIAEYGSQNQ